MTSGGRTELRRKPKTRAERMTVVVTAVLIAPATVGYLSLLEGWEPRTATTVGALVAVWLVVAVGRLSRDEVAVGLVTGTVTGALLGLAYHTHAV